MVDLFADRVAPRCGCVLQDDAGALCKDTVRPAIAVRVCFASIPETGTQAAAQTVTFFAQYRI